MWHHHFCHIVLIAEETVIKISILIIVTVPSPGNTATAAWRASVTVPGPEMMLDAVSRRKLSRLAPCILYLHPRAFVSYSALSCAAPLPSSVEGCSGHRTLDNIPHNQTHLLWILRLGCLCVCVPAPAAERPRMWAVADSIGTCYKVAQSIIHNFKVVSAGHKLIMKAAKL